MTATKPTSLRLTPEIRHRVQHEAEVERRSMAWMLVELITEALDARSAAVVQRRLGNEPSAYSQRAVTE